MVKVGEEACVEGSCGGKLEMPVAQAPRRVSQQGSSGPHFKLPYLLKLYRCATLTSKSDQTDLTDFADNSTFARPADRIAIAQARQIV